jgi:hypothetical protein
LDGDKFIGYRIDGETAFHRCAIASPFAHAEQFIVDALNAAEKLLSIGMRWSAQVLEVEP